MIVSDDRILEYIGYYGFKDTLTLARELLMTESAMRRRLKKLESEGKVYHAVKHRRGRGKFVWFRK